MKFAKKISIVLVLFALSAISAQNVNLNCNFLVIDSLYTCRLDAVTVPDNENANIVIGGQHIPGMVNSAVRRVQIRQSSTPFVITQLFTTFQSLTHLTISFSGLTRIQPNAFANAQTLNHFIALGNVPLRVIPANAFVGATNLVIIDFRGNSIDSVHEAAFNGLSTVTELHLSDNQIPAIPVNLLSPLTSLMWIQLTNNQLTSLNGQLFANNPELVIIAIARNRINGIGRNFLDGLNNLVIFNTFTNQCVDSFWIIDETTTLDTIREGLATCFENFVEPDDEVRSFVLELRGSLVLRYENGTEVVRI